MKLAKVIAIGIGALLVLMIVVAGLLIWKRPLAVFEWFRRQALTRAGLKKTSVETSVGREVLWEGGSGPTLVLLHGAGDQAGTWADVAPVLIREYHVLCLDLPGHGESGPTEGAITLGVVSQGLEEVLAQKTNGPVILVGNSMGAFAAMLYARKYPLKVTRLVAVNGGAVRNEIKGLTLTPANRDEARKLLHATRDPSSPAVPDYVLDDLIRRTRKGPLGQLMANYQEFETHYLDGHLSEVSVPVDLLWGESDHLVPLEYAERMEKELPRVRLTRIPKCGHVPQLECAQPFLGALQDVLRKTPPALRPSADVPGK